MFRKTPEHGSSGLSKKKQKPAASLLISMSTFMALCAERADLVSRKIKAKATRTIRGTQKKDPSSPTFASRQKQLLLKISNKAVGFMHRKRIGNHAGVGTEPEEWSDCGVWQKTILMGDKCEPLDFSGVIYYDSNGNQVSEDPLRTPRAGPLPGYISLAGKADHL
ncbi:hypothetical protein I3843_16G079700 [Carya illinoinensis]|uniref:Uncharacterized protein n=1 Tax=Carya illinoinensis TaxID=32201 RepID=A0A8T1N5C4_CARIL|nr:uncharacterized protein LOC122299450 [Carya illinoinensis]KAG6625252.1 hypothetical protein CIPAW_16G083600 [Carya illinoinensis]KAG7942058.1 hypothetical protein I3843_16G079700 [Carya illinoinensis]